MLKRLAVLSLISALSLQVSAFADTVTLKRGKEVKGIVVEDYQSRIVMSTVDGEQTIMKDDIGEIYYDTEEDNLIKLAERARASRNFVKAYGLYEKALKINPKSKAAQDGLVFCQSYIVRRQEAEKANDVQKRADFERYGGMAGGMQGEAPKEEDLKTRLNDALGMTLVIKDGIPAVEFVRQKSQASEAGIKVGDYIVAVWSRLTGYMSLKEIVDILLEKTSFEIKVTIERTVEIAVNPARGALSSLNDLIGASFIMKFDGLTVDQIIQGGYASAGGLKEGDLITSIDGQATRYMPLKKAIEVIRESAGPAVKITFRRGVLIWRIK